jgi:hypothetical protein
MMGTRRRAEADSPRREVLIPYYSPITDPGHER